MSCIYTATSHTMQRQNQFCYKATFQTLLSQATLFLFLLQPGFMTPTPPDSPNPEFQRENLPAQVKEYKMGKSEIGEFPVSPLLEGPQFVYCSHSDQGGTVGRTAALAKEASVYTFSRLEWVA